jgi:hypothetical protein
MTLTLIRQGDYSRAALLDPERGKYRVLERQCRTLGRSNRGVWIPEVAEQGWYDVLGDVFVALYRDPTAPPWLWFQFGAKRFELGPAVHSTFAPELDNDNPPIDGATIQRTFRLFEGENRLVEHVYCAGRDAERRVDRSLPCCWPSEEEQYDLLFFVHRVLLEPGRRDRVLRSDSEP